MDSFSLCGDVYMSHCRKVTKETIIVAYENEKAPTSPYVYAMLVGAWVIVCCQKTLWRIAKRIFNVST